MITVELENGMVIGPVERVERLPNVAEPGYVLRANVALFDTQRLQIFPTQWFLSGKSIQHNRDFDMKPKTMKEAA